MIRTFRPFTCSVLALLLVIGTAEAKVSPEEAAKLGQELTPIGAIRAGNAEGTIPTWEGGITQPPAGYQVGMHHPDPFGDDQPLFTITAANVDQHSNKLATGQIAMFKRYPKTWKISVYPTRRSASYPQAVYNAAIANATTGELVEDGNGVRNAKGGVPFPIPQNGLEAIWNHILRYRGKSTVQLAAQAVPTSGGSYNLSKSEQKVIWPYQNPAIPTKTTENRLAFLTQRLTSPARRAGLMFLVHEPIDQVQEARKAWVYLPGLRRVRRAPSIAYDNPTATGDGQRTSDQTDMYNGTPNRYTWTLLGRREMYVPYNSYKLHSNTLSYNDIIKPGHINPELLRYELHRVWLVEGKLKEGTSHIYVRRTFYLDEDSWQILAMDQYDHHDEMWRVSEAHVINYYEVPLLWATLETHYDLLNGRYLAFGLNNQDQIEQFNKEMKLTNFTPEALRRQGRR